MVTEIDTQRIIAGFLDHTLPAEEWTHLAHLTVGLHMATQHDLDTSIRLLRDGISQYNMATGTQNTDTGGYHETITVFFAHAMQAFNRQFGSDISFAEKVSKIGTSKLVTPGLMFSFYSKELLFSVAARRGLVEPDLRPLSDLQTIF